MWNLNVCDLASRNEGKVATSDLPVQSYKSNILLTYLIEFDLIVLALPDQLNSLSSSVSYHLKALFLLSAAIPIF